MAFGANPGGTSLVDLSWAWQVHLPGDTEDLIASPATGACIGRWNPLGLDPI
jgi:hypothetical protein